MADTTTPQEREARMPEARLTDELIESMRARAGTQLRIEHSTNNEEATRIAIAKFTAGIGDINPLWSDDEHHLGDAVAAHVAERSRAEIPAFVRFLESNDLDHEVEQHRHIERVVRAHGWCPQTMALWVARLGTCAGQHGHETPWDEYVPESLGDYVGADGARRELLVSLLAGNMAALVWSSLHRGAERVEAARAAAKLDDDTTVFWDDLADQGLGDRASDIVADALTRAQQLVRRYAADGPGSGDEPPHWLRLPEG